MTSEPLNLDIAVVGGGMVGGCLTIGLLQLAEQIKQTTGRTLNIGLIDPHHQQPEKSPGFDARAIALSYGSCQILEGLDLWQSLKGHATAITDIHVSDRGHSGITRLSAEQQGVDYLGQVVELSDAGQVLYQALAEHQQLTAFKASVESLDVTESELQQALLTTSDGQKISASLVLACDGNRSKVRELSGIELEHKPYQQMALISTISTQLPHQHRAFERFTEYGPVALLPLSDNRLSLVWMLPPERALELADSATTDEQFISALQQCFGQRLGAITKVGKRITFPLALQQAQQLFKQRCLLLGNAAQSLHPIAGQGLNLGLRDVATLLDALMADLPALISSESNSDFSLASINRLMADYQQLRQRDRKQVIGSTDTLARLFANPSPLVSVPRNLILHGLNCAPAAKSLLAKQAMGIGGWQPRLVRGLSLTHAAPIAKRRFES